MVHPSVWQVFGLFSFHSAYHTLSQLFPTTPLLITKLHEVMSFVSSKVCTTVYIR